MKNRITMNRRTFIKTTAISSLAFGIKSFGHINKSHIITLSFDDGFKKSFYKIADIYEDYGLKACLNVIASGHLPDFQKVDDWILPELMGSFDDWNSLHNRGHEIMPHSWQHLNLARQPFDRAQELIIKCLDYFEENLEGYKNSNAVFNFPFNASTPELEEFTLSKVLAIRTRGDTRINPTPEPQEFYNLVCDFMGPDNIDNWVEKTINNFLASPGGWLILNTHGLDDEGWGPMSSTYLDSLLKRLVKIDKLEILPTGEVLKRSI